MEVTTPLASLPYKEQIKKKQREVVQLLQQLEDVSSFIFPAVFKGTVRPDWICMRVVLPMYRS
jgi:hypothetical protein